MTSVHRLLVHALALALAGPLRAEVLTVGPSGTYPEISDAIAASQPGDVILVEAGTYGAIVVPHALSILGARSSDVTIQAYAEYGVLVSGIAAGEQVVISGVTVDA